MSAEDARPDAVPDGRTAYLAADGFVDELCTELGDVDEVRERLVLACGPERRVAWAANTWHAPLRVPIRSISDGAARLTALQRNWTLHSTSHHRRARLIAEKLPHVSGRPHVFGAPLPRAPLGSWTLLDADTILAAPDCSSPFPDGEVRFVENREDPPNRAYLKLWEAFTRLGTWPAPGQRCLDLGASPGGWTWVLAQLGAHVVAVDKAPLDPRLIAHRGVAERRGSAFGFDPEPFDWLVCDVVCYPRRMLDLARRWLASGCCERFVCTVKLQGATDHATVAEIGALPGGRLVHLSHNGHELTWMRLPADEWSDASRVGID